MKIFFVVVALTFTSLPAFAAPDLVRAVSVRGEGEAAAKPDIVSVQLLVQAKARDGKAAQAKNAAEMSRVSKVLREQFKIAEKDIQTNQFSLNPEYRYENNGKQVFSGYTAQHGLTVVYRKVDEVGALLDAVAGKGTEDVGVQLQGVSFGVEKRKELELRALEQAMANAEARATALAKYAKRGLGEVLRISDSAVSYQPLERGAMMFAKGVMAEAASAPSTSVSAGEVKVSASVAVDYRLE